MHVYIKLEVKCILYMCIGRHLLSRDMTINPTTNTSIPVLTGGEGGAVQFKIKHDLPVCMCVPGPLSYMYMYMHVYMYMYTYLPA